MPFGGPNARTTHGDGPQAQRRTPWSVPGLEPRDRPGDRGRVDGTTPTWSGPGLLPRDRPRWRLDALAPELANTQAPELANTQAPELANTQRDHPEGWRRKGSPAWPTGRKTALRDGGRQVSRQKPEVARRKPEARSRKRPAATARKRPKPPRPPWSLLLEVLGRDLIEEGPELADLLLVLTRAGGLALLVILHLQTGLIEDGVGRQDRYLPQS